MAWHEGALPLRRTGHLIVQARLGPGKRFLRSLPPITMSGLSPPNIKLPLSIHTHRRGRSSSFLKVEHVDSSNEVALDQAAYANNNAEWVNRKGVCFSGGGTLTVL